MLQRLIITLRRRNITSLLLEAYAHTELGSSLPCSQEPTTGPYPEPDQSSPYYLVLFLSKIHYS
jgi:hypothetical protein